MKIYELARDLNMSSAALLKITKAVKLDFNSHLAKLRPEQEAILREYINMPEIPEDEKPIKKEKGKTSSPWNAADNPWVPNVFRLDKRHKGFYPRFVDAGKIEHWANQGYTFANIKDYVSNPDVLKRQGVAEEVGTDTTLKRKGMILMECPIELVQRKRQYLDKKTNNANTVERKKFLEKTRKISQELMAAENLGSIEDEDGVEDAA